MTKPPLEVIKNLKDDRYKDAKVIFWAGSVSKNIGTKASDLDIVVIYNNLPCAYRETFIQEGWPIDAFVHDRETLLYFFEKVDKPDLKPTLPKMIAEGIEIPSASNFSSNLKTMAQSLLNEGPKNLERWEIDYKRFLLTDLLDDIQTPRNKHEQLASGMHLYRSLAEFYLLTHKRWLGNGKALVRCLEEADPVIAKRFYETFDQLFMKGDSEPIKTLVQQILEPFGGILWDGFKLNAPEEWRLKGN